MPLPCLAFFYKAILVLIGNLLVAMALVGCSPNANMPQKPNAALKAAMTPPLQEGQKTIRGRTIAYAIRSAPAGQEHLPPIFFVHGSPGSWVDWMPFLQTDVFTRFGARIAVDRPGFGDSANAGVILDYREQAEILTLLLAEIMPEHPKSLVVGHSLGGTLVGWMAIDHPEKICAAVSIAGSLSSELEYPRWYNSIADWFWMKWLLSPAFNRSNQEMMVLAEELSRQEKSWHTLSRPIWLIQGLKDKLVIPRTIELTSAKIPPPYLHKIVLPDAGHFVIWNDANRMIKLLDDISCAL